MLEKLPKMPFLVIALAVVSGCLTAREVTPPPAPPVLHEARLEVQGQTISSFTASVAARVENPRDSTLVLERVDYVFSARGAAVRTGSSELSAAIPPYYTGSVEVLVGVEYSLVHEEHRELFSGDAVPLVFNGVIHGSYDGDPVEIALDRAGRLRAPRLPEVSLGEPDGARRRMDEVHATFRLQVGNDNPFEVRVGSLDYTLEVEGNTLRESRVGIGQRLPPSGAYVFTVEQDLTARNIPGLATRMREESVIGYRFHGELRIGELVLPFDETGEMRFAAQ